jgi:hypothetical protein
MHRPTLGVLAIVLLLTGAVMYFSGYDEGTPLLVQAAFLRVGAMLAVLWLALPELRRMRPWMVIVFLAALVGIVFVRKLLIPLIVVGVLVAVLRPRPPRGRAGDKVTR